MPGRRNSSLKDPELYEELRGKGDSKQKAARISNAVAARGHRSVSRKGGKSGSFEDWTVADLRARAKELGMSGYSRKNKGELIRMIRDS